MSQGQWGPPGGGYPPQPNPYGPPAGPGGYGPGPNGAQLRYADVPWFRKSGVNSALILVGVLCVPPLLWACCVIVLTGPVYLDAYDERGNLKQWGAANKVVAAILIVLQLIGIAWYMTR